MTVLARAKTWARAIRRDAVALWLAARDPRTPWYAKALAALVAAYALSPIDLIPDFIPVIGYLDDLVLVPLGIVAVVALLPDDLMVELRAEAERRAERPISRAGAVVVRFVWVAVAAGAAWAGWTYLGARISN